MAVEAITKFTPQLVAVISGSVLPVCDRCLGKGLISNEIYETILQLTSSNASKARTLLKALQYTIAADESLFHTLIKILKEIAFPGSMLLSESDSDVTTTLVAEMEGVWLDLSHKREFATSDPVSESLPSHVQAKSSLMSMSVILPQCHNGKLETATVASKVKAIEKFTPRLVFTISSNIEGLSDHCLSSGLISGGAYRRLLESTSSREDRARKLLIVIRKNIHSDDRCFNMFLNALKEILPPVMDKLISEIKAESEKVQSAPALAVNGSLSDLPPEVDENLKLCIIFDKYEKVTEKLVKIEVEKKVYRKSWNLK